MDCVLRRQVMKLKLQLAADAEVLMNNFNTKMLEVSFVTKPNIVN